MRIYALTLKEVQWDPVDETSTCALHCEHRQGSAAIIQWPRSKRQHKVETRKIRTGDNRGNREKEDAIDSLFSLLSPVQDLLKKLEQPK
jgi:hypothetical protein